MNFYNLNITERVILMKTKLTPQIQEEIVKRLKVGCYAKLAAAAIGICERTYYYWLERGLRAQKLRDLNKKVPKKEKIFLQFLQSVRQAEAEGEVAITAMIYSHVKDDWRAGMELLARKYPERWARKEYMDFKGSVDQGPNKREEAIKEYETMFKGVPRAEMATIVTEMTRKIRDAKNNHSEKNKKTKPRRNA